MSETLSFETVAAAPVTPAGSNRVITPVAVTGWSLGVVMAVLGLAGGPPEGPQTRQSRACGLD